MADEKSSVVKIQDSSGHIITTTPEGAEALKQVGYADLSPEQVAGIQKEEKYGSTGQQIVTGLEGAGEAATFGLSTGLETALGVNPEDIRSRRQINPGSHMAGQVGGLAGSLLLGGAGAANILGRTGQAAAAGLGLGAAEGAIARIGSAAVKGAVETAMLTSGDEVSKMLMKDPDQTAGTAVANVGLSGLLGAGIGGSVGAISPLWEATFGKKTAAVLNDVRNTAHGVEAAPAPLELEAENSGFLKPNADEISGAADRLGVKPTIGTLSDSKFIQNLEDVTSNRPSIAGQMLASERSDVFNKLSKAAQGTLEEATESTPAQTNEELRNGIQATFEKRAAPLKAKYEAQTPVLKKIPITEELAGSAGEALSTMDIVAAAPDSDAAKLALRLGNEISNLKSVYGIKVYRTELNGLINKSLRAGGGPEIEVLMNAKNQLNRLDESAINSAVESTALSKKLAGDVTSETLQDLLQVRKEYASFKSDLTAFSKAAKLGNIAGTDNLLKKLGSLNDEALTSKIFNTDNIQTLKLMKQIVPDQFELARRATLRQIKDASVSEAMGKNGGFDVGKYLRQIHDDKIGAEAKSILFGNKLQPASDIRTIYRALPGIVNPSGTAMAQGIGALFSPQGLINNAADAAKYAVLKGAAMAAKASQASESKAVGLGLMKMLHSGAEVNSNGFKAMTDYIGHTIKGENIITKAIGNTLKTGAVVIPQNMLPDEKHHEKLDKKLMSLSQDPSSLFNVGGETGHYMPDHAVAIAQTASSAVNYLNSIRPSDQKPSPLDAVIHPTAAQKQNFANALTIAEKPLSILNHVKEGTLTANNVVHLQSIYPALYQKLQSKLADAMMDHLSKGETIPYKTRLGMSVFLAQPLDSTMTPSAIQAIQGVPAAAKTQAPLQQQPQQQGPHSMKNINKISQAALTPEQARVAEKQSLKV